MIHLKDYETFWEEIKKRVPELTGALGVTVDENMAGTIQKLPLGSMTLFWIPPNATGIGKHVDDFRDKEMCIIFVMEKYDPSRKGTMDVLSGTQKAMERVKYLLLDSQRSGCAPIKLADMDLHTMPETKFFAGFAGWSLGFNTLSGLETDPPRGPRIFSKVFSKQFN
ncbi:MAG: hypothetical protein J1E95_08630 [Muribaculaceae bacterium]|nr:hypothetical protein [Muribaculaceae bacterium]